MQGRVLVAANKLKQKALPSRPEDPGDFSKCRFLIMMRDMLDDGNRTDHVELLRSEREILGRSYYALPSRVPLSHQCVVRDIQRNDAGACRCEPPRPPAASGADV